MDLFVYLNIINQIKILVMNVELLEQANKLAKQIDGLKQIISRCENQQCEFIMFSFGNGSNREVVCNDEDIIKDIRKLILEKNTLKLNKLISEFENI